jgi:cytochrome b561
MTITAATQLAATRDLQYDSVTIARHWTTAGLVGPLWTIGQTIDFASSGALRVNYRSLHMLLGATLAGVLVTRVVWRLRRGRSLPGAGGALLELVARLTHWALCLLVLTTLGLGLANVWIPGDVILTCSPCPHSIPPTRHSRR